MSERKVLNKYYPPDFDPSKIPRLHLPKERQYTVRLMAPFNMKCTTCGEYIYKGKKFNARKETVQGEEYLGIKVFRFYIKCTRCLAEITFKTDPQNADYVVEHGSTRNFQALKLAEEQAEKELKEEEEDIASNPMKLLEKRTKQSKQEMDLIETLEEMKELNQRHANIDHETMLNQHKDLEQKMRQKQEEEEDEEFVRSIFGRTSNNQLIKRIPDEDSDSEDLVLTRIRQEIKVEKSTDLLLGNKQPEKKKLKTESGLISSRSSLKGLVKINRTSKAVNSSNGASSNTSQSLPTSSTQNTSQSPFTTSTQNTSQSSSSSSTQSTSQSSSTSSTQNCAQPEEIQSLPELPPCPIPLSKLQPSSTSQPPIMKPNGFSLLGVYSDSDSDSQSE